MIQMIYLITMNHYNQANQVAKILYLISFK